jgi:diguanylate cyclase (GGDEF)-like protein/PAS domain S-box-containing protein
MAIKVSPEDRAVLETLARYAFARPGFRALTEVKFGDGGAEVATFEILHDADGPIVRRLSADLIDDDLIDEVFDDDFVQESVLEESTVEAVPTEVNAVDLIDDDLITETLPIDEPGLAGEGASAEPVDHDGTEFDMVLVQAAFRTPDLLAIFSSGGRELRWCNEAFERAIGPAVVDNPRLVELLDDWSQGHFMVKGLAALIRQSWWRGRLTFEGVDDARIPVSATVIAHRDMQGDIESLSLSATPLDEELVPEPADDAAALGALVEHVSELLAVIDRDGRIRFASPGFSQLLQRRSGGLVGLDFLGLVHPDDAVRDVSHLVRLDVEGTGVPARLRLRASDQTWRHLDTVVTDLRSNSAIGGYVLSAHDVTERVESFDRLAAEAFTDPDTGLPNRFRLFDRLTTILSSSGGGAPAAVLLVDLDGMRVVNDHGLAFGDAFLIEVAKRLVDSAGPGAFVARLRSDEFAVVLRDVADSADGRRVADALRVALAKPFEHDEIVVRVTASIGVALGHAGEDPDELLRRADLACIEAKVTTGGNATFVWGTEMAQRESRRRDVEVHLRHALDHSGIQPHYQPIVDLVSGRIVGAEALLRVRDADGALLTPGEFVGAAESAGLLAQLGAQVLRATTEQLVIWGGQMRGDAPNHLAVNISPRQLNDASLPAQVMAALGEAAIEPGSLWLELTEGVLLANQEIDEDRVRFLRDLGVHVGLDEFGAGYSNLAYVRRFPLDFVKIDRSLIAGLGEDERDTAVVRATIELARDLGLTVVAVGVEYDHQLELLGELGCELAQGYLFSPPVAPDEFAKLGSRRFGPAAT